MLLLNHKKMGAWQISILLLKEIYKLCQKFPDSERFNIVGQIKRAALSISNNIAEGAARKSQIERNRFYEIARSSAVEVDNCLEVSLALQFLTPIDVQGSENLLLEEFKLLSAMMNSPL